MKYIKKCIHCFICKSFALLLKIKTNLNKLQCQELSVSLIHTLRTHPNMNAHLLISILRLIFSEINWRGFNLTKELFDKAIRPSICEDVHHEAIGRWFTIESEQNYVDAPKMQNSDRITYYASGREPFLAVANHISPKRKIVLLPYFICDTVYQPFVKNGWKMVHYRVNKDLRMNITDVESLFKEHKPSIAVFMEYSGMDLTDGELEVIGMLQKAGCVTIVDRTQNIYSEQHSKEVDFYCGSLRKWFCCPDGAYLERNADIPLPSAPKDDVCNDVYATTCAIMMFANGLANITKIKEYATIGYFFRRLSAGYVCSQPVRTRSMSAYSKAVYLQERSKDSQYMQQRKENFEYIFQRIASFRTIHPVSSDFNRYTSVPFCFHIYIENRPALCRHLRNSGIIPWIHVPRPTCFKTLDEQTEYMFQHILSLPCDQRYTLDDMKVLCDALEEYERKHNLSM